MRHLLSVQFSIEGDLRFISHRDTLRLFERAFARAAIPVHRSGGFNPRPRLVLPLPRSVGIASRDERLIVELSEPMSPQEAGQRLAPQLPAGLSLHSVETLSHGDVPRVKSVSYELALDAPHAPALADAVRQFNEATQVLTPRSDRKSGRTREVDVRGWVSEVALSDSRLRWTQTVSGEGTARPGEVLQALGLNAAEHLHRLMRTDVAYDETHAVR